MHIQPSIIAVQLIIM